MQWEEVRTLPSDWLNINQLNIRLHYLSENLFKKLFFVLMWLHNYLLNFLKMAILMKSTYLSEKHLNYLIALNNIGAFWSRNKYKIERWLFSDEESSFDWTWRAKKYRKISWKLLKGSRTKNESWNFTSIDCQTFKPIERDNAIIRELSFEESTSMYLR